MGNTIVNGSYEFQNAQLGAMMEILLPKKIEYQGRLFDLLKQGLTNFKFENYFSNESKLDNAKKLLIKHNGIHDMLQTESLRKIDISFKQIFSGCSMYEVDGVFYSDDQNLFIEERTQIIRCFFIPRYIGRDSIESLTSVKRIPSDFRSQIIQDYAELFFESTKITSYKNSKVHDKLRRLLIENKSLFNYENKNSFEVEDCDFLNDIEEYLIKWLDAITLFVFGFVINEITLYLEELKDHINYSRKLSEKQDIRCMEEEIWVTSHWGTLINKTIFN